MRVLIVDDSPADAELLVRELHRCVDHFEWERVDNLAQLNLAIARRPDIALVDFMMPALTAEEVLSLLHARWPDTPVIVVTGAIDDREAARMMDAGASDYLLKDRLGRLGGAIERALSAQRQRARAARLIDGQNEILRGIAMGSSLESTLERIVRLVEAQAPDLFCSILRLDGGRVRYGAAPSLPEAFNAAIEGQPIGPQAGSCGTAMYSGTEVIATDIATDPTWGPWRESALAHNLRACWSRPVFAPDRTVLGAFAIYFTEPREPTPDEYQLLSVGEGLAAIALERVRRESDARLAKHVLDSLHESLVLMDDAFTITDVNPAFERIFGYTLAEVKGRVADFSDAGTMEPGFAERLMGVLRDTGHWSGEVMVRDRNGRVFPVLATVTRVETDDGQVRYCALSTDLSATRDFEQRLAYLSQHDPLTRLANRDQFSTRLAGAIANARRAGYGVGVLLLDLDNFKVVNESLGHEAGDHMLQVVAARLRDLVRDTDVVARLGGDEFAVLLAEVDSPSDCAVFVERMMETLREPFMVNLHELYTSCSVGVTLYPQDGTNGTVLLSNADTAMYNAKASGRDAYQFFSAEMNAQAFDNLLIASELRSALTNQEFVLHFQPRFTAEGRKMTGVEALIRWNRGGKGLVPPARFIPVAEDTGMIGAIGDWALREACRQAVAWRAEGRPPITMAVNLSARQLQQARFANEVAEILKESGMPPEGLVLEITESMLMRDPEAAASTLKELAKLGVRIALDDFGTGYSSLSYLKQFAIDDIKIDRSFVTGLPDNTDDRAIVRAIVAVAQSLGMGTVAEGVETEAQLECLRGLRCDEIQGYLLGRPVPADEVEF